MLKPLAAFSLFLFFASAAPAQILGTGLHDNFHDKSVLQPPAGSPVAIIVFEDLGCPACAHDHAIEADAAAKAHVPLIRYDFPIPNHIWTFQAAVCARYVQDTLKNPSLAEQYRADVFKIQAQINSKDDLQNFTRNWFQKHGKQMPFALGPDSLFGLEVQADYRLGERMGVVHTPTIIVLAPHGWVQVVDVAQLYTVIDQALAQTAAGPVHGTLKKPIATGQH